MASPEALRVLRDLQSQPKNKVCCDCEMKNPQWASVNLSCFFCLECSGRHRSLGVHLSFVRSVTMDSWSNDQLKKMQLGGNERLINFLKSYGVDKSMSITEKYNTQAAEFYREMLRAEFEGRSYTPPPPSSVPPPSRAGSRGPTSGGVSQQRPPAGKGMDDWGDWGDKGGANGASGGSGGFGNKSEYSKSQLEASMADKDNFFARQMAANQSKPEGLPPNQGGKYVGFGSGGNAGPPRKSANAAGVDDVTQMLSKGLNTLGQFAAVVSTTAVSTVKAGTQTLQDKQVTEVVSVAKERAAVVAQTGWSGLKSLYATVASTVETAAKQQGYNIDLGSTRVAGSSSSGGGARHGAYGSDGYQGFPSNDDEGGDDGQGWGGSRNGHAASASGSAGGGGRMQSQPQQRSNGGGNNGFAGFDDGAEDSGWNKWDKEEDSWNKGSMGAKSKSTSTLGRQQGSARDSPARPAAKQQQAAAGEEDEWGKW